ncbi:MAG: GIY-YIG nuclease family protein, partial [Chloroflexales bacterium]
DKLRYLRQAQVPSTSSGTFDKLRYRRLLKPPRHYRCNGITVMPYMYILECGDGSYYTGSTKDLECRLWQHEQGLGARHTAKRLPVKLVYCEYYDRVEDAFYREKQVQGWGRRKKQALIEGATDKLVVLSRNYTQYGKPALADLPGMVGQPPGMGAKPAEATATPPASTSSAGEGVDRAGEGVDRAGEGADRAGEGADSADEDPASAIGNGG